MFTLRQNPGPPISIHISLRFISCLHLGVQGLRDLLNDCVASIPRINHHCHRTNVTPATGKVLFSFSQPKWIPESLSELIAITASWPSLTRSLCQPQLDPSAEGLIAPVLLCPSFGSWADPRFLESLSRFTHPNWHAYFWGEISPKANLDIYASFKQHYVDLFECHCTAHWHY